MRTTFTTISPTDSSARMAEDHQGNRECDMPIPNHTCNSCWFVPRIFKGIGHVKPTSNLVTQPLYKFKHLNDGG